VYAADLCKYQMSERYGCVFNEDYQQSSVADVLYSAQRMMDNL